MIEPCRLGAKAAAARNDSLPLGLQVIGRIGEDARTLACARWIEARMKESRA